MGMYKYISKFWQDNKEMDAILKERMITWRRQPTIIKIDKPSRLDKARTLGYKAKQGFVLARIKILKGGRRRRSIARGRKPSKYGLNHFSTTQSLQAVAELRANKKFPNLEVLNSYYVGDDSKSAWYEIILIDNKHPAIQNDTDINWIVGQRRRAFRGLTAAAKRSKGARRIVSANNR
jgi:large subunit ribosomal protein L15e